MLGYILRRLLATLPVMLIVAVFVFLMLRLTPGDPAAVIAGDNANSEQVAAIRNSLGLDQPIFTQFFIWFGNILRGDFGESYFFKKTVAELITSRFEPTLALSLATIIIAVAVAVPLGVLAAYKQGTLIDKIVMGFSVLGFSVPVFVIGYSLIYLFAIKLNWLPVQGYQRIGDGFGGFLQRLIMPALTLSVIYIALIARMTRTSVLDVMGEDYIRTARAKGLSRARIIFKHALRNAAIPVVSIAAVQLGFMLGGSIVIETVFALHGVGYLGWESIAKNDFPVVQAVVLVLASIYIGLTLLADILNALLDPRLRTG